MSITTRKLHGPEVKCSGAPRCLDCVERDAFNVPWSKLLAEDLNLNSIVEELKEREIRNEQNRLDRPRSTSEH